MTYTFAGIKSSSLRTNSVLIHSSRVPHSLLIYSSRVPHSLQIRSSSGTSRKTCSSGRPFKRSALAARFFRGFDSGVSREPGFFRYISGANYWLYEEDLKVRWTNSDDSHCKQSKKYFRTENSGWIKRKAERLLSWWTCRCFVTTK